LAGRETWKKYNQSVMVRKMALVALRATKISALDPVSLAAGRAVMIKFVRVLPVVLALTSQAMAQAGSAGGSIGNDEKSVSGTRSARPEMSAPPAAVTGFDGTWVFTNLNSCGRTTTSVGKFVGGKLVDSIGNGTIAASGEYHYARAGKNPSLASGQFATDHASGNWRLASDKCRGTWTAVRQ
jgi:hypothetical protein